MSNNQNCQSWLEQYVDWSAPAAPCGNQFILYPTGEHLAVENSDAAGNFLIADER